MIPGIDFIPSGAKSGANQEAGEIDSVNCLR